MIIMNDFVEINKLKNGLVDSIIPLLDDLRNKRTYTIRISFVVTENTEIMSIKSAMDKICSDNPDIQGRVDAFYGLERSSNIIAELYEGSVKGATLLLFLDKYQDRFNYPDINRFYAQYPEFYTGGFDEDCNNDFFSLLLDRILAIKENFVPFSYLKIKTSTDNIEFVSHVVNKVKEEGLKCKVIKQKTSDDMEHIYFFIYETEHEEMNKMIQPLEKRSSIKL